MNHDETDPLGVDHDVLLLIHGTGATAPEDEGDLWWQRGSAFSRALEQLLGGRVRCPITGSVFRWSGANRESQRRLAARVLLEELLVLEHQQRQYHLIGHSHGGSVIWEALVAAAAHGKNLKCLASWATVGTPFMRYRPRRSDWLLLVPLFAATGLWFQFPVIARTSWASGVQMYNDGAVLTLAALAALIGGAAILYCYLVWRIAVIFSLEPRMRRRARAEQRAHAAHASKWLGLWTNDDEAINGLKNLVRFETNVAPRAMVWADIRIRTLRDIARLPFVLIFSPLYNFFVARTTDAFISDRIARHLQGNDRSATVLDAVSTAPIPFVDRAPLRVDIREALTTHADAQAAATLGKLRQTLGAMALGNSSQVIGQLTGQLSYQELVHTSYFDNRDIQQLLADHISRTTTSDGVATDHAADSTSGSHAPISRERWHISGAPTFIVSLISTGVILALVLLITAGTASQYARALPYTDDSNIAALLQNGRLPEVEDDPTFDSEKEVAIRNWMLALAESGHADVAVQGRSIRDQTLRDKAIVWTAVGLARRKEIKRAEAMLTDPENPLYLPPFVEELIRFDDLEVALFVARLAGSDRELSIGDVAEAHALRGDADRAFQVAAELAQDSGVPSSFVYGLMTAKLLDQAALAARRVMGDGARAELLIAVAKAMRESGSEAKAKMLVKEAIEATVDIESVPGNLNPGSFFDDIEGQLVDAGFVAEALSVLDNHDKTTHDDNSTLAEIADAAALAGDVETALKAVPRFPSDDDRALHLGSVVRRLAETGRIDDANRVLAMIPRSYYRDAASETISAEIRKRAEPSPVVEPTALARTRELATTPEERIARLREFPASLDRDSELRQTALDFAAVNKSAGLEDVLALLSDPEMHKDTLLNAIDTLLKSDHTDAAMAIVEKGRDSESRAEGLLAIANHLPGSEGIKLLRRAEPEVDVVTNPRVRSELRCSIAAAYARAGAFYRARVTAESCYASDRLNAYALILREYSARRANDGPSGR